MIIDIIIIIEEKRVTGKGNIIRTTKDVPLRSTTAISANLKA